MIGRWRTMKARMTKTKTLLLVLAFVVGAAGAGYFIFHKPPESPAAVQSDLSRFSEAELAAFDGSDPNKPIYLAMNGFVYDVSAGRQFYEPNGVYHFLAGRDSSKELNMIGGDIIARKYPVIGIFFAQPTSN